MNNRAQVRQAMLELVGEVRRTLQYFDHLGITHYDDIASATGAEPEPAVVMTEVVAPTEQRLMEPITRSAGPTMVSTKKTKVSAAQASLFGESAVDEQPTESEFPPDETLEDIRADLGDCRRCKLYQFRTHIVFGEGNPRAELMFVGEGPGADEDATGRPFVGRAGQLLDRMIEAIGLKREAVYIANVIKSRPPGNRAPEPDEIAACVPFLYRQINVIKPKLIVALGTAAAQTLLQTKAPISKLRGRFFDFRGAKLLPTFHPAFLLRSPNMKKEAWEDLKKVRDFLQGKLRE